MHAHRLVLFALIALIALTATATAQPTAPEPEPDAAPVPEASPVADNLSHGVSVDAMVKVAGFDATIAGYLMKLKSADADLGGVVQVGYVVVPKQLQVAGRFAFAAIADSDEYELEGRAAVSYFFAGHALKVASDIGFLKETGGGDPELQIRIMPQLTF